MSCRSGNTNSPGRTVPLGNSAFVWIVERREGSCWRPTLHAVSSDVSEGSLATGCPVRPHCPLDLYGYGRHLPEFYISEEFPPTRGTQAGFDTNSFSCLLPSLHIYTNAE